MEAVSAARPSALSQASLSPSIRTAHAAAVAPAPAAPVAQAPVPAPLSPVMALLRDGVPLTLLLDLAWGVSSQEVYAAESADLSWLRPPAVA